MTPTQLKDRVFDLMARGFLSWKEARRMMDVIEEEEERMASIHDWCATAADQILGEFPGLQIGKERLASIIQNASKQQPAPSDFKADVTAMKARIRRVIQEESTTFATKHGVIPHVTLKYVDVSHSSEFKGAQLVDVSITFTD